MVTAVAGLNMGRLPFQEGLVHEHNCQNAETNRITRHNEQGIPPEIISVSKSGLQVTGHCGAGWQSRALERCEVIPKLVGTQAVDHPGCRNYLVSPLPASRYAALDNGKPCNACADMMSMACLSMQPVRVVR